MSSRRFLAVVGAVAPLPRIALGAEFVNRVDLAAVRAAITGHNGKLIELTPDHWQFLRGIYAMNLETPPGLPCGDEAVLAHVDGEPDSLVLRRRRQDLHPNARTARAPFAHGSVRGGRCQSSRSRPLGGVLRLQPKRPLCSANLHSDIIVPPTLGTRVAFELRRRLRHAL